MAQLSPSDKLLLPWGKYSLKKGKALDEARGWRRCEEQSYEHRGERKRRGGGAADIGAEIPLQPVKKPMIEQVYLS